MKLPQLDNADAGALIAALFVLAFFVALAAIGPWEAVRGLAVELAILGATFWVARQYLPWEDAPRERIQRPRWELTLALLGFALIFVVWPLFFRAGDTESLFMNVMLANAVLGALVAAALLPFGYSPAGWGWRLPTQRELGVLAAVAAIAIGFSWLAGVGLPPSEAASVVGPARPLLPGVMLWSFGNSASSDLLPMLISIFALSVLGQELFFRIYLQPRLASYLPGRWALFVQAALYYAACVLPFFVLTNGALSPAFLLTQAAALSNGVLAGYFWRKTGSLPLLILLHALAFARWGL